MKIVKQIEESFQQKLPFVAYRKPKESLVSGLFQKNDEVFFTSDFSESGFVFAPFDAEKPKILIPKEQSEFIQETITISGEVISTIKNVNSDISEKKEHLKMIEKAIEAINQNKIKKVVLSRKEEIDVLDFNIVEVFKRLLLKYNNAMVYVWYHPAIGLWLGATPETFLKIDGKEFTTMSLAGTQTLKKDKKIVWKAKEIDEQQLVTDYIVDSLSNICDVISIADRETSIAGNLVHLKTKISGNIKDQNSKLIEKLHPTPAVCGMPLLASKEFIKENEIYKRTYYTGFLGELNIENKKSELFVNLRCMKVENNKAIIFIGGGITKDSIPEKEWEETIAKAQTMKSIL
ncbi:isochorismate synthase [Lutibacter sp. Hel_I_33_5]|uniref:chorismate-binding protein n=1 Tax=Lutibacter sp. Hel_I_33_5 TaxID=1566289 RepID=UPI0011A2C49B|nr:chorismate-binding protein [Lutibacter sp. Hel_I_33_5]TVZ55460.1 isochorismate synthase [Lutibacter sp. Hel_I_33_5]